MIEFPILRGIHGLVFNIRDCTLHIGIAAFLLRLLAEEADFRKNRAIDGCRWFSVSHILFDMDRT